MPNKKRKCTSGKCKTGSAPPKGKELGMPLRIRESLSLRRRVPWSISGPLCKSRNALMSSVRHIISICEHLCARLC